MHPFAKKNKKTQPLLSFRHCAISFKAVLFPLQGRAAAGHSEQPAPLEVGAGRVNATMWVVYFENLVHFTSWELVTAPWSQIHFHFLVLFPMQLPTERNNKKLYFSGPSQALRSEYLDRLSLAPHPLQQMTSLLSSEFGQFWLVNVSTSELGMFFWAHLQIHSF